MTLKWSISFFFVICVFTIISFFNFENREYDWDMPGYLSSLHVSKGINDPEKIHSLTYGDIKKEASKEQFF